MILSICVILETVTLRSDVSNKEQQTLGQDITTVSEHYVNFDIPFRLSGQITRGQTESLSLYVMLASKAILAVLLLEVHFCQRIFQTYRRGVQRIKKRGKDISEEQELVEGSLCGQLVSTFRFNGKT